MPKVRYEAAWVPGLLDAIQQEDSLRTGLEWLERAESKFGTPGCIVMYAKQMMGNDPVLTWAAGRWEFVSTRSRSKYRHGPVLCVWPSTDATLELAESMAFYAGLCVIPGSLYDVSAWIERSGARCLVEGFDQPRLETLPEEVAKSLDFIVSFGGHNNFLGGGEKEITIRGLHTIARRQDKPTREALEAYLRASGESDGSGAARVGKWYDEILGGKRHKDYRGQIIRPR